MDSTEILSILRKSDKFEDFTTQNPNYDVVIRYLSTDEQNSIQKEFAAMNLFPQLQKNIVAITLVSQVLKQNGYPKLKAYLELEKKKILHLFISN